MSNKGKALQKLSFFQDYVLNGLLPLHPPPFNSQKLTKTVVTTNLDDRGEGEVRGGGRLESLYLYILIHSNAYIHTLHIYIS